MIMNSYLLILICSIAALFACSGQSEVQSTKSESDQDTEMYSRLDVPEQLTSNHDGPSMYVLNDRGSEKAVLALQGMYNDGSKATDLSAVEREGVLPATLFRIEGGAPDGRGNFKISKAVFGSKLNWVSIPGQALRLAASSNKYLWVVQNEGNVFKYDFATGVWRVYLEGLGKDISVNKTNDPVILWGNADSQGNYAIYKGISGGASWTQIPGAAYRISIQSSGKIWVVQWNGNVFYYDGSWNYMGNPAPNGNARPDIAVSGSGDNVTVIGKDGRVYSRNYWNNYTWTQYLGYTATAVATPGLALSTFWGVDPMDQTIYTWETPVGM